MLKKRIPLAISFNIKDKHLKWLLILPTLILLTVFAIIPYLWTFGISFYDYSVQVFGRAPDFVGFQNYENMMTHPDIWLRFQNTAKFAVTVVSIEFILGLSLALVLSERFRGHRLVLTICVLPMLIAPEITAMIFKVVMFRPDIGFINYLLGVLKIPFDGYGKDAFLSIVMVDAWTWTPFVMLMIVGGLSSVPKSVLEAADIEINVLFQPVQLDFHLMFFYFRIVPNKMGIIWEPGTKIKSGRTRHKVDWTAGSGI